jgi:hypothetical protein
MLLRFEAIHIDWQFSRRDDIRQKNEFPTDELGAIAQIEIFGERVVLPAAGIDNARFSPEPSRAIEIEKTSAATPGGLFQKQMAVQEHGLNAGEQRVTPIQMSPARLDHPDLGVSEEMDRVPEQIAARNEIRVEDANEFAFG